MIDLARSVAASQGQDNAIFHVGDVTDLEFEDSFFDVAHCCNVLMHRPGHRCRAVRGQTRPQARRHLGLP